MRIYIIGFMGSGKSTYGQLLANDLGYHFLDLDEVVAKGAGMTIAEIFEKHGEEAFRKLEHEALYDTGQLENYVIATGGGTPCFDDNMRWISMNGLSIYLKLFEGELKDRLLPQINQRPLLKDMSQEELELYIYNTLRERAAFYHRADIVIDPTELEHAELAEVIKAKL